MFTKQIAFTAPLSLLLYEVCFVSGKISKKGGREIFIRLFPFFAIWPLVYFKIFHSAVATAGLGTAAQETSALSRQEYFLTQWLVVCRYLRLLVLPVGLNFDYDFPIQHALSGETLAAGAFLMLLFFLGVFFYRRGARLPAFGVFWFFLTLSVESSFIPIRDVIFEHRVYLPMLGFAVTISWFLWRIFSSRPRLFIGLSATLIFVFGTGTYLRNRVWASELALWQDTVRKSPNKARPVNNLGVTYLERGELDKAYDCYRKAIALNPNYMDAYINLGDLYEKRKDYAKAIDSYLKALTFGPKTSAPYENLGRAYGQLGRYEDALKYLGQAIEKNPYSVKAYAHRGTIYDRLGRFDEAIDAYRKAVEVDPTYAFALKTLGSLYGKKGDYPRSILYLRKAGQLSPNDPDIHYQLGIGYLRQGQFEESAEQGTILMRLKRPDLSEKLKRGAAQDSQRNLAR
jgi:tetratricopeptide (TPR) repeat protein